MVSKCELHSHLVVLSIKKFRFIGFSLPVKPSLIWRYSEQPKDRQHSFLSPLISFKTDTKNSEECDAMLDKEEDTKALFIWESKNQDMSLSYKEINAYLKCRDICFLEEYSYAKCF